MEKELIGKVALVTGGRKFATQRKLGKLVMLINREDVRQNGNGTFHFDELYLRSLVHLCTDIK